MAPEIPLAARHAQTGKPRVLMLSGVYPDIQCGNSPHTYRVARAVAELGGWDVQVLTSDRPEINRELPRNFELHPLIKRWTPLELPQIIRLIERFQPHVVHVQNPTVVHNGWLNLTMPLLFWAGRSLWRRTRLVVTQHDLAIGHWTMQRKHGLLLTHAHAVTVSNQRDYQAALRLGKGMAERTYLAHLASLFDARALDGRERAQVRADLEVPPAGWMLAFIGYIVPGRKIESLLRAAAILKAKGVAFKLMIIGGPGPGAAEYLQRCRRLCGELAVEDQVKWLGYVPNHVIERTMAASDLFISPIERGADFRNGSFFPAIQLGVPILTTENPRYGIDYELRDSGICRFFNPAVAQDLAAKIIELLTDKAQQTAIKTAMAQLISTRSWQNHALVLDRAYQGY